MSHRIQYTLFYTALQKFQYINIYCSFLMAQIGTKFRHVYTLHRSILSSNVWFIAYNEYLSTIWIKLVVSFKQINNTEIKLENLEKIFLKFIEWLVFTNRSLQYGMGSWYAGFSCNCVHHLMFTSYGYEVCIEKFASASELQHFFYFLLYK